MLLKFLEAGLEAVYAFYALMDTLVYEDPEYEIQIHHNDQTYSLRNISIHLSIMSEETR